MSAYTMRAKNAPMVALTVMLRGIFMPGQWLGVPIFWGGGWLVLHGRGLSYPELMHPEMRAGVEWDTAPMGCNRVFFYLVIPFAVAWMAGALYLLTRQ